MELIRVLVADDHPIVRQGLRSLFAQHPDMLLVGEVGDGRSLLSAVASLRPHVIILDLRMPQIDGLEALRRLRRSFPDVKTVVLSSYHDPESLLAAVEAGTQGYLQKSVDYDAIVDAVRAAAAGESMLSPALVGTLFEAVKQLADIRVQHDSGLDAESLHMLAYMAEGATNSEIATRLHWSEVTVKRRIQEILDTLGVRNRTQAVAEAIRRGWV